MRPTVRIDAYLSRKAAAVWPGAVVEDRSRVFVLVRPTGPEVVLAGEPTPIDARFRTAKEALAQAVAAERARRS